MKALLPLFVLSALTPLAFQAAAPPDAPEDAHDLVLLHPSRPYRIRLHLRVAGAAFQTSWNRQTGHLFCYLDVNGDGFLSKTEAARAPSREQWQQLAAGSPQIDPDAAPDFAVLARGKPAATPGDLRDYYRSSTAGPLQVGWGRRARAVDALSDELFRRLDINRDGKLSRAELEAVPGMLERLDVNEDEMVSPAEIMGRPYDDPGPPFAPGLPHGPAPVELPFFSLPPGEPGAALAQALLARYDRNGDRKLDLDEMKIGAKPFTRLDRDGDGKLDAAELARWRELPADLEVDAPLADKRQDLRLTPGNRTALSVQPVNGEMLVVVGDWRVDLRLDAPPAPAVRRRIAAQALFRRLDANASGYLEEGEVYRPPFTHVAWLRLADRDGDGRLSEKEFVRFAELQQKVQGSLSYLRVADHGRSLFRLLDTNGDGRLGLREMRNARTRLKPWDPSGAGGLHRDQIPRHFQVTLGRRANAGNDEMDGRRPQPRPVRGPLWFRKMDRNGDGDVSRGEWLGTALQFHDIDTDGDGLISVEEAERHDRRRRTTGR